MMLKELWIILLCLLSFQIYGKDKPGSVRRSINPLSVVVIDAGHGGKDWGASIGNIKEKDIVLDIALNFGKLIEESFPEIDVQYTRKTDKFVTLRERAYLANSKPADLFISIHVNSVKQNYVNGTETYVFGRNITAANKALAQKENEVVKLEDNYQTKYRPASSCARSNSQQEKSSGYMQKSRMLAQEIQQQFSLNAKRNNREVRQAEFLVLRETQMPGVLIETGFITNHSERSYLGSKTGRNELAESLFMAFQAYKTRIEIRHLYSIVQSVSDQSTRHIQIMNQAITDSIPQESPNIRFAVQIMALKRKIDPSPGNFRGEQTVYCVESADFNRYFVGEFKSLTEAVNAKSYLHKKFNGAFVVAFENSQLISVKKALERL